MQLYLTNLTSPQSALVACADTVIKHSYRVGYFGYSLIAGAERGKGTDRLRCHLLSKFENDHPCFHR